MIYPNGILLIRHSTCVLREIRFPTKFIFGLTIGAGTSYLSDDNSIMATPNIIIYSGGGAKPSPNGPGGWAALIVHDYEVEELSGREDTTTNVRMQLMAVFMALESLDERHYIEIHTDSLYLKRGITSWLPKWTQNGWHATKNQTIQNKDLWEGLYDLMQGHEIRWKWIKRDINSQDMYINRIYELVTTAREYGTAPKMIELTSEGPDVDVSVYVSAWYKGGPWGATIVSLNGVEEMQGHEADTTGNQSIMIACVKILKTLTTPQRIAIYSSNEYLINGMSKWLRGWIKNDWKTAKGEPVKNQEQWQHLSAAAQVHTIIWMHLDDYENPYARRASTLYDVDLDI